MYREGFFTKQSLKLRVRVSAFGQGSTEWTGSGVCMVGGLSKLERPDVGGKLWQCLSSKLIKRPGSVATSREQPILC